MQKSPGLTHIMIVVVVIVVLALLVIAAAVSQVIVERNAFTYSSTTHTSTLKELREIDKLAAEVRKIRSDTVGSLFWLKMVALLVTVGGAVGGYLVGHERATRARIDFEDRKNVDAVYQSFVEELSNDAPVMRAAAAVKLGSILKAFPEEWNVKDDRREQLIRLTKEVLAAALAIEDDHKVLKMLTIALRQHRPSKDDPAYQDLKGDFDLRDLDLSGAKAADAYWARVDFTYTDFYLADLTEASLRKAILRDAQLREAKLNRAVLAKADCKGANFKLADLRGADLTGAILTEANFEETRVNGVKLDGAILGGNPNTQVDISRAGDGSKLIASGEWLAGNGVRGPDTNTKLPLVIAGLASGALLWWRARRRIVGD